VTQWWRSVGGGWRGSGVLLQQNSFFFSFFFVFIFAAVAAAGVGAQLDGAQLGGVVGWALGAKWVAAAT
jgi:hypothetical protein